MSFPKVLQITMYNADASYATFSAKKRKGRVTVGEEISFRVQHFLHKIANVFKRIIQARYSTQQLVEKFQDFSITNVRLLNPQKVSQILPGAVTAAKLNELLQLCLLNGPNGYTINPSDQNVFNMLMPLSSDDALMQMFQNEGQAEFCVNEVIKRYRTEKCSKVINELVYVAFSNHNPKLLQVLNERDFYKLISGWKLEQMLKYLSGLRNESVRKFLIEEIKSQIKGRFSHEKIPFELEQCHQLFQLFHPNELLQMVQGSFGGSGPNHLRLYAYFEQYSKEFGVLFDKELEKIKIVKQLNDFCQQFTVSEHAHGFEYFLHKEMDQKELAMAYKWLDALGQKVVAVIKKGDLSSKFDLFNLQALDCYFNQTPRDELPNVLDFKYLRFFRPERLKGYLERLDNTCLWGYLVSHNPMTNKPIFAPVFAAIFEAVFTRIDQKTWKETDNWGLFRIIKASEKDSWLNEHRAFDLDKLYYKDCPKLKAYITRLEQLRTQLKANQKQWKQHEKHFGERRG